MKRGPRQAIVCADLFTMLVRCLPKMHFVASHGLEARELGIAPVPVALVELSDYSELVSLKQQSRSIPYLYPGYGKSNPQNKVPFISF